MTNLAGKTALVTGGTRGIGRAMVDAIAADGANIVLTGRNDATAQKVAAEVAAANGVRVAGLGAQLTEDDAVDALFSRAVDTLGPIDILVNNAGLDADCPAIDHTLDDWRRVLKVNLEVPFRLAQQAARHLVARNSGGVIINVASIAGFKALNEASSYVASKHGLVGLTKSLALEWGPLDIRVCGIAPGLIKTDLTEYIWGTERGSQYIASKIPIRRIGLPEDIGALTLFLASDAARFIHGETIVIDGGSIVD